MIELPRYQCHKIVQAAKVDGIVRHADGSGELVLVLPDRTHIQVPVSNTYMLRCQPRIDGYYVRYEDDYESWSPAATFLGGYTLIEG